MIKTIALLIPLLVPLVLAANLLLLKPKSRLEWIMAAWLTIAFSLYYFLSGAWFLLSVYARYIIAGLVFIAVLVSLLRLPRGIPFTNFSASRSKFSLISYLVPSLIFTVLSASALMGLSYAGTAANLEFPLKNGSFYIAQGGGTSSLNAHHPYGSQIYSIDILQLDGLGRNAAGLNSTDPEQYAIFGSPVYSPCQGSVAAAVDGIDDLPPGSPGDTQHPAGNHVYIDCQKENIQVLLAHLRKGSLVAKEGSLIEIGDLIGQVGNSGNTIEPHLHIHARQGGTVDKVISGSGIPILFNGWFPVRNNILFD